ncbi:MAG: hypothetical protein Q4D96_13785 [Propionibacteriaceae bacterium]|nr:hypothetical protein [Propionibacteriaceae bacterium]
MKLTYSPLCIEDATILLRSDHLVASGSYLTFFGAIGFDRKIASPRHRGKTPFSHRRSSAEIMTAGEIPTDQTADLKNQTGPQHSLITNAGDPAKLAMEASREGVPIRVITQPLREDGIITAYPTQWPPLKATPGELALRNESALAASNTDGEGEDFRRLEGEKKASQAISSFMQ